MKRQWSHPWIALPLLVALFLLLTFRCSQRHAQRPPAGDVGSYGVDAELAELAAVDPAAEAVLRDAERLLETNLTSRAPPELRDAALRGLRGWMGMQRRFDPGVMAELVDLIKRPIDDRPRPYASCAVVGNSGVLLAREHGALIDAHDLVIRLNNAPAGEEGSKLARHVGARTGLAFLNSNVLSRCAARGGGCRRCRAYGDHVPILTYMCNAAHFVEHAACTAVDAGAPVIVTDPRLDAVCARVVKYYSLRRFVRETGRPAAEWGSVHEEGMFHYSSGLQAVVAAAGVCGRVSVFGFGKEPGARHHYHTLQRGELDLHDYEAEYEFYRDLEERPEAIPFLRDSGFRLPPVVVYR
ncbi:unnamed protein product [Urochloa humidicola]